MSHGPVPLRAPGDLEHRFRAKVSTRSGARKARVNIDYHVELEGHWYSVPYQLVGKAVELRHTEACAEAFLAGRRVASHMRSEQRGRFTTQAEHMPASHRQHA
ncbi:hypothetical protein JQX13_39090 [Archangium violaceum]|nr:hypothetical protein JQX13_39090 [Archangium violaceum]